MRGVGGFYLLLAVLNLPPLAAARLSSQYPTLELLPGSGAAQAIVDLWFLFGVELGVLGAALLWASRRPLDGRLLVVTVLWLEAVRGVAMDLYWVGSALYDGGFYAGFAALHAALIVIGLWALRRASTENRQTPADEAA